MSPPNANIEKETARLSLLPPSSSAILAPDCAFCIVGGGIVGLVLALCLYKDCGIVAHVYEQTPAFLMDAGAGMGMYPNGLRVLRHVHPDLLAQVQAAGYPYLFRRYERHDGTLVALAEEGKLCDESLQSMGIQRARLQKILYDTVQSAGIPIHFGKRVQTVEDEGTTVLLTFVDGSTCRTEFLFAADGARSQVRSQVLHWNNDKPQETAIVDNHHDAPLATEEDPATPANLSNSTGTKNTVSIDPAANTTNKDHNTSALTYIGTTCLMGMASIARPKRGICFPSSLSSKLHAVFLPTGKNEQCFQLHFSSPDLDKAIDTWGKLSTEQAQAECRALAAQLRADGWHEDYVTPLEHVTQAVRVGFGLLQPRLARWVYGSHQRVILLGDSAHPPVPYLGQGAQMGLEDAGTISLLMKHMCLDIDGKFQTTNYAAMTKVFQQMRIPRTRKILEKGKFWGKVQEQRSETPTRSEAREKLIKRDVFFHEALPILFPGATYDFIEKVNRVVAKEVIHLEMVSEEQEP